MITEVPWSKRYIAERAAETVAEPLYVLIPNYEFDMIMGYLGMPSFMSAGSIGYDQHKKVWLVRQRH